MEGDTIEKVVIMDPKEINQEDVCEVCQKIKGKINETNWKRHTTACKGKENKKRKIEYGNQKMTKYFKTETARIGVDAGVIVDSRENSDVCEVENVGDIVVLGAKKIMMVK